jgi:isopenicillin N synthase-like dioxygenase
MSEDYPYGYENYESLGVENDSDGSGANTSNSANQEVKTTTITSDSKETFSIGPSHPNSKMPPRRFPSHQPAFQKALTDYYTAMETLAATLFRGMALALDLECDWFLRREVFDMTAHQCALRILNYPPLEYYDDGQKNKTMVRAGAHTDYGALTILLSGGPGLQLCLDPHEEKAGNTWMDVPHLEGAFIINLGDLMQRWTNDRWKSTLHRVVAVPDDDEDDDDTERLLKRCGRRQSVAFFVNMNGDANIVPFESCVDEKNPARYEAIKASDHLMQRHLRSMGKQACS